MTDQSNPDDTLGGNPDEERIGELINEFFDRRQRGEDLSHDAFLAEHEEHADELRQHLAGLNLLEGMGSSSKQVNLPGDKTKLAEGSSGAHSIRDSELPPPQIPGYEIHKLIGRGGMGLVYKAVQISTKRQVALKVLLEGPLASAQARRRFEREIELVAQLRHTNIIPIYDSGSSDGRLYYAMAYVRGLSLTDYLGAHRPDLQRRLRMFSQVCEAVRHAHQRGVVHRDLKPSNILVDSEGVPHILDFGLAKAGTFGDMTTSITAQIVGTPAYMSPEQAAGDPSGIDVRTDIYSLGVVLYETLTGHMPYETNISMGKLLENIAHAEPVSPSSHDSKIDGELSAIMMKALEKSKDDRYQSLDAFHSDIMRYLAGEPISVKPASGLYILKKAVWKHRLLVGVATALVVITGALALVVRHFVTQLDQKETAIRQQEEQLKAKEEKLKHSKEMLEHQRAEAEKARAAYESVVKTLDPRLARALDIINRGVAENSDLYSAGLQVFVESGAQLAQEMDSEQAEVPDKHTEFDLVRPQMSQKPADVSAGPTSDETQEMPKDHILEILRAIIDAQQNSKDQSPTTQPTSTQPTVSSAPSSDAEESEDS
ncbi:MAG: serine/threonine protein kinase [Phycisphaerales bacterium]|nr:serine/threonine protein kinase [Phycisphaerales bacterium]